jgi:hypothetical protein
MAAREVIHSRLEAQPLLHAVFGFHSSEARGPHLKTQCVLLLPLPPTDLVIMKIHVCA